MATGKHRTTKRSPGGSYTSTISTVVFMCIFILGVWMLTSNSYASSNKSTTRISQSVSIRKIPIDPPAFEDNPGDLPEDAIQPDDGSGTRFDPPATRLNETKPQAENITGITRNQNVEGGRTVDSTTGIEDRTRKSEHHEKENDKQTYMTGGDKTGERDITEEEQEKRNQNDMQADAIGGNDKFGTVDDEEHDITKDEHEQTQNEDAGNDQIPPMEEKPVKNETNSRNGTKPPMDEVKTETNTTTAAIATIAPTNDSLVAAGGSAMIVDGSSSGIPMESKESKKDWKTQADESDIEKEKQQGKTDVAKMVDDHKWELCNVTSGTDYVPCLDNEEAINKLVSRKHYEHRERHCPEVGPTCLVPMPDGYKSPIPWPQSRNKV